MAEQFTGIVEILDDASEVRVELDGISGDISVRDGTQSSLLNSSSIRFNLDDALGNLTFASGGTLFASLGVKPPNVTGTQGTVSLSLGNINTPGQLTLADATPSVVNRRILLDGASGRLTIRDAERRVVLQFDSRFAVLDVGAEGNEGDIRVRDNSGSNRIHLDGNTGRINLRDNSGDTRIRLDGNSGEIRLDGDIRVRDNSGDTRIHLDSQAGDIRLLGADCAEEFEIAGPLETIQHGAVMVLDQDARLRQSCQAYDSKVVGVVSGAGDLRPGIILGRIKSSTTRIPLALTGRVYCQVDAQFGSIAVGDLLTTSETPGHAMKASDRLRAFGAVIGKALKPLREGQAMIPILVALQ